MQVSIMPFIESIIEISIIANLKKLTTKEWLMLKKDIAPVGAGAINDLKFKTQSMNNKDTKVTYNDYNNISLNDIKRDVQKNTLKLQKSFPLEVFPKAIKDFILDEEDALNSDRNYLSASILSALSLAIGSRFQLEVKPTYVVKANLYIAIVGLSGTGKSHPMRKAYSPLDKKQRESFEIYQKELRDWEKDQSSSKPTYKKYFLDDFTLEALMEVHSHNPMGVGIFADELLGWFHNMNRYSNGSDREKYLSLWNGDSVNIDRVSKTISIDSSFLNILGGIQPGRLNKIINEANESDGFVHRILWLLPLTNEFKPETNKEPNPINFKNYKRIINQVLHYREQDEETLVKFNDESLQKLFNWRNNFRKGYHYGEEFLRGASVKVSDYTTRFILILTVLEHIMNDIKEFSLRSNNLTVSSETVDKAILLTEYFMENVKTLRKEKSCPTSKWTIKMKKWYERLPATFKTREAIFIGEKLDISKSSIEKYLAMRNVFANPKHGEYKKLNV